MGGAHVSHSLPLQLTVHACLNKAVICVYMRKTCNNWQTESRDITNFSFTALSHTRKTKMKAKASVTPLQMTAVRFLTFHLGLCDYKNLCDYVSCLLHQRFLLDFAWWLRFYNGSSSDPTQNQMYSALNACAVIWQAGTNREIAGQSSLRRGL